MKNLKPVQQMVGILVDAFIYGNVERRIYDTSCGAGYFWTLHIEGQEIAVSDNRIYDWPLLKRAILLIDEVEQAMSDTILTIDIEFYGDAHYAHDQPPAFMDRHEGHSLKVCDEYGYLYSAEGVRGSKYERADA